MTTVSKRSALLVINFVNELTINDKDTGSVKGGGKWIKAILAWASDPKFKFYQIRTNAPNKRVNLIQTMRGAGTESVPKDLPPKEIIGILKVKAGKKL